MPILIRIIAQRIILLFVAFLSFIGLAPEADIVNNEEKITTEERKEIIGSALDELNTEEIDLVPPIPNPPKTESKRKEIEEIVTTVSEKPPLLPEVKDPPQTVEDIEIVSPSVKIENPAPKPESETESDPEPVNSFNIKDVVVSVVCVNVKGNSIEVSNGSGIIISPSGLVITNAHVALPILLHGSDKTNHECTLRQEGIITPGYAIELVYIPPQWVEENWRLINASSARGTGEKDYALLHITQSITGNSVGPFDYSDINTSDKAAKVDDRVVAIGYPGQRSSVFDINSLSELKIAPAVINDVFTFNRTTIDIFSTTPNIVAQKGSSGGGVFEDDKLIGLIVTTNPVAGSNLNSLNALTISYINKDIKEDYGTSINQLLNRNLESESEKFLNRYGNSLQRLVEQAI
jgi:hypothetical protein